MHPVDKIQSLFNIKWGHRNQYALQSQSAVGTTSCNTQTIWAFTISFCTILRKEKQFIPFAEPKIKLKIQNEATDICNKTQCVIYDVKPEFLSIILINFSFQRFKISRRYTAGYLHRLYFMYRIFPSVKSISIIGQRARTQLLVLRRQDVAKDRSAIQEFYLLPE
jgi:hypothetical protein